ncbi:unnamed protein product [Lasius platythorax]|uniref:Uncharacterized protein n=1 Tax=Lasius platythorax TaxID=488582 RepID=A0AAV2MXS1_9HYME
MVRDFRSNKKKWTPGIIIEESVPGTTYHVDVEGQIWKRHINQIVKCNQDLLEKKQDDKSNTDDRKPAEIRRSERIAKQQANHAADC